MDDYSCLTTKVVKKIREIPPGEWERVFPNVLEGYQFFKSMDESDIEGFSFYYILVYEKDALVGLAPCFLMDYPLETSVEGPLKKILSSLRRAFPRIFNLKALVCGSAAGKGRIGISCENDEPVITAIVGAMEKIAKDNDASLIAFKDFSEDYTKILGHLPGRGFYKIAGYPSVELDIRFKSFDEHVKSLSRATRKDLKRKFKHAEKKAKVDFEVPDGLGGLLDEAYGLYLETYSKSGVQFEKMPRDFFKNISENMRGRAKYFLWRINGRLVAFDLCLVSCDTLIDEYVGFDYSEAYRYNLYFTTFRDIMNWCATNGIKRYESGALSYEPKKRLGCRFIPLFVYAKHMNRFINPFFRILSGFLKPENYDDVLKAMKREGRL